MNRFLRLLPPARQDELRAITRIITTAIHPEKIMLFGVFAGVPGSPDLQDLEGLPDFQFGYDILVVTRHGDRRCDYELQDNLEGRCRCATPVTVLVHDIDYVNDQILSGSYFFSVLRKESIVLFDAGFVPLAEGPPPDLARIKATAQKDFDTWWFRAEAFFRSVVFNRQQREWRIAAFLLHQTVENAYQAVLLTFTGYKPCTHNLDKLRRYSNRFSIALSLIFPRNTPEEDHLFKLLLLAYVDARYKEEYTITERELDLLIERVNRLLSVAAGICRNRVTSLGKMGKAA